MPMPPIPVALAFDSYLAAVIPRNATPVQIEECRRAFYAGVTFLIGQVHDYIGDDSVSEDDGQAYLTAINQECDLFLASLREAKAQDARAALGNVNYTTPDPDDIKTRMREIGHELGERIPPGYGFMLLIFNFGEGGSTFYISNGERDDMIKAMREFIQRNTQ